VIIVFVALEALLHLRLAPRWEEFAGFLQLLLDAVNDVEIMIIDTLEPSRRLT
jgi:hypothetical protein